MCIVKDMDIQIVPETNAYLCKTVVFSNTTAFFLRTSMLNLNGILEFVFA
jgi:hypothetical protein